MPKINEQHLLDEIRLHGEEKELVDEIVTLGKRYGIVTPYTSYLVTEDELARAPHLMFDKLSMEMETGREAVEAAKALGKMKKETLVFSADEKALSIRIVDEKVFYLKNEVWVDSEYREDIEEKILVIWNRGLIWPLPRPYWRIWREPCKR